MDEIRISVPRENLGFPYLVCKNYIYLLPLDEIFWTNWLHTPINVNWSCRLFMSHVTRKPVFRFATRSAYLPTYPASDLHIYLSSNLPTSIQNKKISNDLSTSPVTYLPVAYLTTFPPTDLPTYMPTNQYIHNFIRMVPIIPYPTFSGSHWSWFRYELKSVSVPTEVRSGQFRSVPVWNALPDPETFLVGLARGPVPDL